MTIIAIFLILMAIFIMPEERHPSLETENAMKALRAQFQELYDATTSGIRRFSGYFADNDARYAEGIRRMWDGRTDRALQRIIETGGSEKVYGPMRVPIPDSIASVSAAHGVWSSMIGADYNLAYGSLREGLKWDIVDAETFGRAWETVDSAMRSIYLHVASDMANTLSAINSASSGSGVEKAWFDQLERLRLGPLGAINDIEQAVRAHGIKAIAALEGPEAFLGLLSQGRASSRKLFESLLRPSEG